MCRSNRKTINITACCDDGDAMKEFTPIVHRQNDELLTRSSAPDAATKKNVCQRSVQLSPIIRSYTQAQAHAEYLDCSCSSHTTSYSFSRKVIANFLILKLYVLDWFCISSTNTRPCAHTHTHIHTVHQIIFHEIPIIFFPFARPAIRFVQSTIHVWCFAAGPACLSLLPPPSFPNHAVGPTKFWLW